VVRQLVRGHYSTASVLNTLPMDVLELVIVHLARDPYSCATVPAVSRSADSEEDNPVVSAAKRRAVAPSSP
jgi:hypothetical protein